MRARYLRHNGRPCFVDPGKDCKWIDYYPTGAPHNVAIAPGTIIVRKHEPAPQQEACFVDLLPGSWL